MNGSVTISLSDFEELKNKAEKVKELDTRLKTAAKELEIFLSYLVTRENIEEHLSEFNRQSTTSKILIIDGKAKINLLKETNN
jgi:hypothetical protein